MGLSLGGRLKFAREAAGFSQRAVSSEVGADTTTISRWENDRLFPGLARLEQLAKLYRVSPSWIAFGEGAAPAAAVRQ